MQRFIVLIGLCVACGGADAVQRQDPLPPDPDPQDDLVEADPGDEVEAPPPTPSGPVEVTITVKVSGEVTNRATVQLVSADGETAYEGAPGTATTVQSGAYSVVATITDASVVVDTPTTTMDDVVLEPGDPQTVEVVVPVAKVRLQVQRNGRPISRANVTLFRQDSEDEVASFRTGQSHISISPGRYEADVLIGQTRTRVRGLTFMDGATQNIPVNIQ